MSVAYQVCENDDASFANARSNTVVVGGMEGPHQREGVTDECQEASCNDVYNVLWEGIHRAAR